MMIYTRFVEKVLLVNITDVKTEEPLAANNDDTIAPEIP